MRAIVLTLSGKSTKKEKSKGICLAVYYPDKNKMYRLVSDENAGELPISWKDNLDLLDVIEFRPVSFIENGPQTENIVIDMNKGIRRIDHSQYDISTIYNRLYGDITTKGFIFGSSFNALEHVDRLKYSLVICKVTNLIINKNKRLDGSYTGKAEFDYGDFHHRYYSVTDFDYDIRKMAFDRWPIGDAYIVVSIPSVPYENNGKYYKFISAIYRK